MNRKLQDAIIDYFTNYFNPTYLNVENISHMHKVPHGAETHFSAYIVSDKFDGKKLIDRQRMVHESLKDIIKKIHSISQKLQTPQEWEKSGKPQTFELPECFGGKTESERSSS